MLGLFRLRRNRRGTSTLEFALMLPLVMIFFIGIIQYSIYFFVNQSLQTFVTYATRSAVIEAQANAANSQYFGPPGAPSTFGANTKNSLGTLLQVTPFLDPNLLALSVSETNTGGVTTITATASYPWTLMLPAATTAVSQSSTFSFAN